MSGKVVSNGEKREKIYRGQSGEGCGGPENAAPNGEKWKKISRGQSGEAGGCPESVLPNGDLCEEIYGGQFGESDACPGMRPRTAKNGTKPGEGGGCSENVFSSGEKMEEILSGLILGGRGLAGTCAPKCRKLRENLSLAIWDGPHHGRRLPGRCAQK